MAIIDTDKFLNNSLASRRSKKNSKAPLKLPYMTSIFCNTPLIKPLATTIGIYVTTTVTKPQPGHKTNSIDLTEPHEIKHKPVNFEQ